MYSCDRWDLDACRNEFIRRELFSVLEGDALDTMSKRAAILSSYLALLRNDAIPTASRLQISVAKNLPTYEDYASFHPILVDLDQIKIYLGGEHSPTYQHLKQVRQSLNEEYDMLASTSKSFAKLISRQDYLACRIAVQSRTFELNDIPTSEVTRKERTYYKEQLGIDFTSVISFEPVNDWMNSHVNNNVRVGGYNAKKRTGQTWSIKDIKQGDELINSYGETFYNHVLFVQYGYIPTDGSGQSVISLAAHHDINLVGGIMSGTSKANDNLQSAETMLSYLKYDYGSSECITKENQDAFELKQLKLKYLQRIGSDRQFWVLPLPPRVSTETTPRSTTTLPDDYNVPAFSEDIYEYLNVNALSLMLPCRLITLTGKDIDDAKSLLQEDLDTLDKSVNGETPPLRLEELEVSLTWMIKSIHCMKQLAKIQFDRYEEDQIINKIHYLAQSGRYNSLEWHAAHVALEEMQIKTLEIWATAALESVVDEEIGELYVRTEPCPSISLLS